MAWFLVPYKRKDRADGPGRYCAMDDFTALIRADGGRWDDCIEILDPGIGRAIVKVVGASPATLSTINAAPGFIRIPLDRLDDPLSSLTAAQRTAIKNQIRACGYTLAEVNARFPDLATVTIGEALRFLATRKRRPRYDGPSNSIICDGSIESCEVVDDLDRRVT